MCVSPLPALSQGVVKAQYGDWQMSCDTPPGASFEQCAIIQNVTAEDQPNVGLSVIVLKTADQKARLLRVLAPLGVLLPNGLGLNIDGTDMGRVAFVRCLPNGCVAEVVMDDALLNQLSNGKTAIFVVFKTPEEGIGIPVSLKGFADGFKQLPQEDGHLVGLWRSGEGDPQPGRLGQRQGIIKRAGSEDPAVVRKQAAWQRPIRAPGSGDGTLLPET